MSTTELHYCTGLVGLAAAWGSLAVAVGALLVGLGAGTLWRWRGARRDAAAVAERELESVRHVASALARTQDVEGVARALLDEIAALFDVDSVALAFVSEDAREASGFLGRSKGEDVDWWREMRLDLMREPSGIASAVQAADGFAVYDVADTRVSTEARGRRRSEERRVRPPDQRRPGHRGDLDARPSGHIACSRPTT